MLKENEFKKLVAPPTENSVRPVIYLIQRGGNKYLIHRQLINREHKKYSSREFFEFEGDYYLFGISVLPTEEEAELCVKSIWNAVQEINKLVSE